jgi:DNA/RNA-binding domain of Phe-tRNA-synthetase-like protein
LEGIRVGVVEAEGLDWQAAGASSRFPAIIAEVRARGENLISATRKSAVRGMLRYGSYKPAGRAKPSSEYLLQAALEGDFPAVNYFVDAVNIVSLVTGYPISIVDLDKSGSDLLLRRGRAGEAYVFNAGGQAIDLADLLCVCRAVPEGFIPTANPVRDSMATKIFPGAPRAAAFIYAPAGAEGTGLEEACRSLCGYLAEASRSAEWAIA